MADLAPIVLFIYNRPEHTRRTLTALAANPLAANSDLIIYADGPKNPEHDASVTQAREVARAAAGFGSVTMIERGSNLGLGNSIIAGVSEVCAARGRAIVLEDDLLVVPQFLSFMNAGLVRFEADAAVKQISGFLFPGCEGDGTPRFLPLTTTWGWATWQRAWDEFDIDMSSIERLRSDSEFRERFDLHGAYDYSGMVEQQRRGAIDSWGIRWYLSVFAKSGLILYPGRSLVDNIGFDGSGTHGAGHAGLSRTRSGGEGVGVEGLPESLEVDHICMKAIESVLCALKPRGPHRLIVNKLRTWLKR